MGVITSEYGAWKETDKHLKTFKRLDNWQDDLGRRMRFVNNPYGSTHPEATLLEALGWYFFLTSILEIICFRSVACILECYCGIVKCYNMYMTHSCTCLNYIVMWG